MGLMVVVSEERCDYPTLTDGPGCDRRMTIIQSKGESRVKGD